MNAAGSSARQGFYPPETMAGALGRSSDQELACFCVDFFRNEQIGWAGERGTVLRTTRVNRGLPLMFPSIRRC